MFQNNLLMAAASISGDVAYTVDNSCRFNDGDGPFLSQTPGTPDSVRIGTISIWVKLCELGLDRVLLGQQHAAAAETAIILSIDAANKIDLDMKTAAGAAIIRRKTTMLLRDPGAWYHIHISWNKNKTGDDSCTVTINGIQQTDYTTNTNSAAQDLGFPNSTKVLNIGEHMNVSGYHYDGYMAQNAFIDGTEVAATSFGEFNNGVWRPVDITGLTYGADGWLLDFADSSDLGNDISGNSNDFTSSGLAANDQMTDTPTNNVCTLSPLRNTGGTLANGNLQITAFAAPGACAASQSFSSGKKYWEVLPDSGNFAMGILADNIAPAVGSATGVVDLNSNTGVGSGTITDNGSSAQTGLTTYTSGDVIGVAVNADSGLIDFYKDEVQIGVQEDFSAMSYSFLTPFVGRNGPSAQTGNIVFNEDDFTYTPPTGYTAISTTNAPEPTVKDGRKYFDTILYEGNGAGQKVGQFQPITETYTIADSLMVNGVDETLQRTPGSTGNDNTWTISLWFKRSKLDADQRLFTCFSADALKQVSLGFDSSNRMSFMTYDGGFQLKLLTTRTFGDTSQWVHVVAFYDDTVTTPGSSDCGLYINGVQETVLTTSDYPSQNDGTTMNLGNLHWIGASSESSGSTFYSGYYADFYIIDGTKQAASDFGEVDSTTNRWIPKDATGLTFGTNGVYLDYADKNDLGDDESGNGNDFTEVNIDTTNGSNQFHDTPTRNFLTGDTSQKGSGVTVSNGGLTSTADGSGSEGIRATNLSESTVRLQSGKWYFEYLIDVIDAVQAQPNLMPFIWEEADLTDTSLTSGE